LRARDLNLHIECQITKLFGGIAPPVSEREGDRFRVRQRCAGGANPFRSIAHQLINNLLISANSSYRRTFVVVLLGGAEVGVLKKPRRDSHAVAGGGRHSITMR
jgi:hypothetical protein